MSSVPVVAPTKPIAGTFPIAVPQVVRFDLSIADVINLFTTTKVLLPALPNYAYIISGMLEMRSGDPYDTQPGDLIVEYGPSNVVAINTITPASTFLITAAASKLPAIFYRLGTQIGTINGSVPCFSGSPSNIGGHNIQIRCATGNPTVSGANPGSPLIILIQYEVWPTNSALVGLP